MVAVAAVAAVAAVLGTINAIIGIFNGLPKMSDKGQKEGDRKLKIFITYLQYVKQKVEEEAKLRNKSKCSETSITADVKPLDGELEEAQSIVSDWRDKKCQGKRLASKKFIEKLEKSEKAISRRLREFLSYTRREEAGKTGKTAACQPQPTNINAKYKKNRVVINGNVIHGNVIHNLNGRSAAQRYNIHPSFTDGESGSESFTDEESESTTDGERESPSPHHEGNHSE